jgi:hypothetical protein
VATASVALLASCGSSSDSKYEVTGKQTTLQLGADEARAMQVQGVTVAPVAPATSNPSGGFTFPVTGGDLDADYHGRVQHSGGLTFSANGKSLTFSDPVIDTQSGMLSAEVEGNLNTVLQLTSVKIDPGSDGSSVTVQGVASSLRSAFSLTVSGTLGINPFAPNQSLGPVVMELTYRTK